MVISNRQFFLKLEEKKSIPLNVNMGVQKFLIMGPISND